MSQFLNDVLTGLSATEKYLESKYFYDAKGDVLFQKIMGCPEYYPTKCELEIFLQQKQNLVNALTLRNEKFDVIELGAGDASKSVYLLEELMKQQVQFTYYPVDISGNVIHLLQSNLPQKLPGILVEGLNGEYFNMLKKAKAMSRKPRVVLFLGSNIGNVPLPKAAEFCEGLRSYLQPGDVALVGFDLKKDPRTILSAYNDKSGYTRDFNLNLLHRINRELEGNFDPDNFYHYPNYDPGTGTCKSYLVSTAKQEVSIAGHNFSFEVGEPIHTEISQKYSLEQIDDLAAKSGFKSITHFFDSKRWFVDAVWECV